MASDTAAWVGGLIVGHVKKIVRLPDGSLFGAAGLSDVIEAYVDWASGRGEKPEACKEPEDFEAIRAYPDGGVRTISALTFQPLPGVYEFMAAGSPQEFLLGAMAAGASAADAVRLAIEYHADCAGAVISERLEISAAPG